MSDSTDVALLLRWCDLTCEALREARHEIDALNVYPVPDGDTGTNLHLTFEAARAGIPDGASLAASLAAMGRGALVGARGNSGVIVSQLLRAGAEAFVRGDRDRPARLLADTLLSAAEAAYAAVTQPVEGTMLSVAGAAASAADERARRLAAERPSRDSARAADGAGHRTRTEAVDVLSVAAQAARRALAETPDQLDTLRRAGVVDAGGMGVCIILDAAVQAVMDDRPSDGSRGDEKIGSDRLTGAEPRVPVPVADVAGTPVAGEGVDLPLAQGFEVMYLLDAAEEDIPALRVRLDELGDSVVVVGGDGLWNVHAHVDDAGAAVEAGIVCGRPHQVRVTPLAEVAPHSAASSTADVTRGLVAVAAGEGLASLFAHAGAEVVLVGAGRRCSPDELLAAIRATGSREVLVLPNDPETVEAAEAAARAARAQGLRVAVVPSRAQVQGLAAIAVHELERSFDDDVVHMTSAAGHARHGAVTIATRDAMTMAGPCTKGDSLGVVDGDFAVVGSDVADTALTVVDRLLSGGGEMVTLVTGHDVPSDLTRVVTSHVERTHPGVDVVVYDGGQRRYLLLIGVE